MSKLIHRAKQMQKKSLEEVMFHVVICWIRNLWRHDTILWLGQAVIDLILVF